mmetsp:Transcript_17403/g.39043  ORF Transcript_17403/g.39043 Transcript_17403/m.39043 type:complete len:84 (+) Transcript_17403:238-489(+)
MHCVRIRMRGVRRGFSLQTTNSALFPQSILAPKLTPPYKAHLITMLRRQGLLGVGWFGERCSKAKLQLCQLCQLRQLGGCDLK